MSGGTLSNNLTTSSGDIRIVHFDSGSRNSGTNAEPVFVLSDSLRNIQAISVKTIRIPFSYYVFRTGTNVFIVDIGGGNVSVTIPAGNYINGSSATAGTLGAALKTALDAALGGPTVTVTFDSATGKYTIAISAGTITVKGIPTSTANAILGFSTTADTGPGASVTGANVANMTGPDYLFLASSQLSSDRRNTIFLYNQTSSTSIITSVTVDVNPWDLIYQRDVVTLSSYNVGKTLTTIGFSLYYPDGSTVVDLNGMTWSIELEISVR